MASIVLGTIVAATGTRPLDRRLQSEAFDAPSVFVFVAGAFLLGGLSHVFADMLSAPDMAQAIKPLWPVIEGSWQIDLIWYNSPLWNLGLLIVALSLHGILAYAVAPIEHPYRIVRR